MVTRDDRVLQGFTGGYKQLYGVTASYEGLQGITKDYRKLVLKLERALVTHCNPL